MKRASAVCGAALLALSVFALPSDAEAASRRRAAEPEPQSTISGAPVLAIVSIKDQRVSLYDGSGGVYRGRVSSGRTGYETPPGIYSILQKNAEHYSNLYDDASMPFMQRLTWSGVALHAGALPGYPASHGCVRLPYSYAQQIFPLTKIGMRVILVRNDVAPVEVSHALLLKPLAPAMSAMATPTAFDPMSGDSDEPAPFLPDLRNWPGRQAEIDSYRREAAGLSVNVDAAKTQADELKNSLDQRTKDQKRAAKALKNAQGNKKSAEDKLARATKELAEAKKERAKRNWESAKDRAEEQLASATERLAAVESQLKSIDQELVSTTASWKKADEALQAALAAWKAIERKTQPISIFISSKEQRLYVRQGHEPVFDAPITVANPESPIGTHVFTAVDFSNQGKDLRWMAVSLRPGPEDADEWNPRPARQDAAYQPPLTDKRFALAALDRVTIPAEVKSKLAAGAWPGASIIVSDEDLSKETGKATDFIVVMSGEPQGALKKRPRQQAPSRYYDDYYYSDYYYDSRRRPRYYKPSPKIFSWW